MSSKLVIAFAAAALFGAALMAHHAEAAVCRSGAFWDAFPVAVDWSGGCVSRMGWVGQITPD
jgi:hypothetical protein